MQDVEIKAFFWVSECRAQSNRLIVQDVGFMAPFRLRCLCPKFNVEVLRSAAQGSGFRVTPFVVTPQAYLTETIGSFGRHVSQDLHFREIPYSCAYVLLCVIYGRLLVKIIVPFGSRL